MAKNNFDFNVKDGSDKPDVYDFSDLVDLSTLPPSSHKKVLSEEDEKEEKLQIMVSKAIKVVTIFVVIFALICGIGLLVTLVLPKIQGNKYVTVYNAGVEAYDSGDYAGAIDHFEEALTFKNTNNINERLYLYKCYMTTGNQEKAISTLVDLLEYDTYNLDAIKVIANYYYNNNKDAELEALIAKYVGTEAEATLSAYTLSHPTVSFESGEYQNALDILITTTTADASIYYTLDGSTPSKDSILFTDPVHLGNGTYVLKTALISSSGVVGPIAEYNYTINIPAPDAPEVLPESGTYKKDQQIEITNVAKDCICYYTIDGTVPDELSFVYTEPIDIPSGSTTFAAVIYNSEGVASEVVTREYER